MPRKSNASNVDDGTSVKDGLSVEDLALPRTMIQRLAKGVLPANTQIQKDALLALSKSATVFVNYISNTANENAQRANKKTIQPKDVLDAIRELEFEAFAPRMEEELLRYNAAQCDKRNSYRRKVKEEQLAQKEALTKDGPVDRTTGTDMAVEASAGSGAGRATGKDSNGERAAKKMRGEDGEGVAMEEDVDEDDADLDQGDEENEQDDEETEEEVDEDDEDDESGDEDPNDQLIEDPLEEREDHGIGDEALDGDVSD